MVLPVLAFVQTCQPGSQDNLRGEDGAVPYLRGDDLIDGQQGTLAKICFLRIGVGVGSSCAGGFAIKISGIMVAAAIHNLGR